jgi:hypothetical protein
MALPVAHPNVALLVALGWDYSERYRCNEDSRKSELTLTCAPAVAGRGAPCREFIGKRVNPSLGSSPFAG